jgi:hypothetical protein
LASRLFFLFCVFRSVALGALKAVVRFAHEMHLLSGEPPPSSPTGSRPIGLSTRINRGGDRLSRETAERLARTAEMAAARAPPNKNALIVHIETITLFVAEEQGREVGASIWLGNERRLPVDQGLRGPTAWSISLG